MKTSTKNNLTLIFLLMSITGIMSLLLGVDQTTELELYHYFNVFSFLNNGLSNNIIPSGIQSCYNPLLDIPYYILSKKLYHYPYFFVFIQGCIGGILLYLVFKISDLIFKKQCGEKNIFILFSLLLTIGSWNFVLELATCMNDLLVSVFILLAFYILLINVFTGPTKKKFLLCFLAGILSGFAVGFKLTAAPFPVAIIFTLLFFIKEIPSAVKTIVYFSLGGLLGFLLIDGHWLFMVYSVYKNPFFPLFNNFFKSGYTNFINYSDTRYFPVNITQWIFYPFYWLDKSNPVVTHWPFVDFRCPFAYISVLILYILYLINKKISLPCVNELFSYLQEKFVLFLLTFVMISYILWLNIFSIYRYFMPADMLLGILICIFFLLLRTFFKNKFFYLALIVSLVFFMFCNGKYQSCRVPIKEKLFYVEDLKIPDGSVVFLGGFSVSYYAAFQNPNVHYIYLYGDLNYDFEYSESLKNKVDRMLCESGKNIYFIIAEDFYPIEEEKIRKFANIDLKSRKNIKNNFGRNISFYTLSPPLN